ncbi:MAG: GTPase Era [Rhodospirillales bacterium]
MAADPIVPEQTRSAFIAVIGAPNTGKSTFINRAVGTKVSIVSPKVQTTRTRVIGIVMADSSQLVFIDTPGIFQPSKRLDRAMVAAAWSGAEDADRLLLLIDAVRGIDDDTRRIVETLTERKLRCDVIINKTDAVRKPVLLQRAAEIDATGICDNVYMISALTGDGVNDLIETLAENAPDGPWMFPPDQVSDMPERQLAAEITREQLFRQLHQELPYATTVETESWQQRPDGSIAIDQVIFIERQSQRAIVLGKGGSRIKSLGTAARKELSELLECTVHLKLFVKVREKWGDDPERYGSWGLDFNA